MQTFLPYPSFTASAMCLDRQRLGKQRVETWQIYRALTDPTYGWQNHPAVRMWRGHEWSLLVYGGAVCAEWAARGYTDNMLPRFRDAAMSDAVLIGPDPAWLGNPAFHASHRAALLYKSPTHYAAFGWTETPALAYVWPTLETTP